MDSEERGVEAFEKLLKGRDEIVQRGTCKKCGGTYIFKYRKTLGTRLARNPQPIIFDSLNEIIGHLTFECKNMIKINPERDGHLSKVNATQKMIDFEKDKLRQKIIETREKIKKTENAIHKRKKMSKSNSRHSSKSGSDSRSKIKSTSKPRSKS